MKLMAILIERMTYYLSEHPTIVGFRWSHTNSWGSTWSFLFFSIALFLILSLFLHLTLSLFGRRRPIPLGPVPAFHGLAMAMISATIFLGLFLSSAAEIRDTRWFWGRSMTPLQWLFCFPLGTRPTGRVFFWSYVFYLARFFQLIRAFFSILRRRKLTLYNLFHHPALLCMSFLWLEFSQSFQVVAILCSTLVYSVLYGYRFLVGMGLNSARPPVVLNCHILLIACSLISQIGVLLLHFNVGGCNGIGALAFNSVLNGGLLLLFLDFYMKMRRERDEESDCYEGKKD